MSSEAGKDEKLAQFQVKRPFAQLLFKTLTLSCNFIKYQDVTGIEGDRATFFLESANWNLEMALGSFYENLGQDEDMEAAPPAAEAAAASPAVDPEPSKPTAAKTGGNVSMLSASSGDSDEDDEQGQAFYAGGSTSSGQQILGPPKKKPGADFVKDMFRKARQHGAEAVDPSTSKGGAQAAPAFTGTGFKLGSSESAPTEKVPGAEMPKPPRQFVLKMWRNGFSIDDGDLRPYNDPHNRAFLSSVMTGRIPQELVTMAEGGEVHVDMEDHKEEEFAKPKGAHRQAFTGSGHVLGGIAPSVDTQSSTAPPPNPEAEKTAQNDLKINESEPTTSIQVRLPDGKRLIAKVNHSHTVGDLRRYVTSARPDYANFSLHTTYPPKELTDEQLTVKDAGLVGAAVMLRQK